MVPTVERVPDHGRHDARAALSILAIEKNRPVRGVADDVEELNHLLFGGRSLILDRNVYNAHARRFRIFIALPFVAQVDDRSDAHSLELPKPLIGWLP